MAYPLTLYLIADVTLLSVHSFDMDSLYNNATQLDLYPWACVAMHGVSNASWFLCKVCAIILELRAASLCPLAGG